MQRKAIEGIPQTSETVEAEHQVGQQSDESDVPKAEQTSNTQEAEQEPTEDLDAYNKVLCTTELLEAILEYLPAPTLYSIQRVNRQFQAVILTSQRIQQKLFYRIDNKRPARWDFHYEEYKYARDEAEIFEMERVPHTSTLIPVMMSRERFNVPRLCPASLWGSAKEIMAKGEDLRLQHDQAIFRRLGQQSSGSVLEHGQALFHRLGQESSDSAETLVSKLQRQEIKVKLCFALGIRLPTLITFTVKVKTTGPLEVGDIIEKALNTRCHLHVQWRLIDGYIKPNRPELYTGVPKQIIEDLKRQTGLKAYLKPMDSSFRLCRFVRTAKVTFTIRKPVMRTMTLPWSDGSMSSVSDTDAD